MSDRLSVILFVKTPERGNVKSRLASAVGEECAQHIYKSFILDVLGALERSGNPVRIFFFPPDSGEAMENWLGRACPLMPQTGKDLGERMESAFAQLFSEGGERAVLIGSDIPDLTDSIISSAFESLDHSDAVIGPASDGGYYLIGFKRGTFLPDIFHGITWSTGSVFHDTMKTFERRRYRVEVLPEWRDVDTIDDLLDLFLRNKNTHFNKSGTMTYLATMKDMLFPGEPGGGR